MIRYSTQFIDLFYGVVNQILLNIQKWVTMNGRSQFYCVEAYKHTILLLGHNRESDLKKMDSHYQTGLLT